MRLPDDIELRAMTFDAARVGAWRALLSEEERARYEGFPVEKRRREFLLGRVALRTLLAEHVGQSPSKISLHITEEGALEAPDVPYHVSLAHSRDRAVAVIGRRRLGVDLERIAERNSEVERFMLREDERMLLDALPMPRAQAFVLCWTLKEAVLKALGMGFMRSPKKVHLDIDADAHRAIIRAWDESTWQAQFEAIDGFMLAVAYEKQGKGGGRGRSGA